MFDISNFESQDFIFVSRCTVYYFYHCPHFLAGSHHDYFYPSIVFLVRFWYKRTFMSISRDSFRSSKGGDESWQCSVLNDDCHPISLI